MEALFLYYVTCFNPQTIGQRAITLLFVSFAQVFWVLGDVVDGGWGCRGTFGFL
jgi:hypothetical protein